MIEAHDLFEAHLAVTDLDAAIRFYRDVVGLRVAHVVAARQAAFFWVGPAGNAMLGLWAGTPIPSGPTSHTAFRVSLADLLAAPRMLASAGVMPLDFDGRPADQPVVLAWMPAAAVYFRDPDGNLLEYISMLPDDPRPERGVVSWSVWQAETKASNLGAHLG